MSAQVNIHNIFPKELLDELRPTGGFSAFDSVLGEDQKRRVLVNYKRIPIGKDPLALERHGSAEQNKLGHECENLLGGIDLLDKDGKRGIEIIQERLYTAINSLDNGGVPQNLWGKIIRQMTYRRSPKSQIKSLELSLEKATGHIRHVGESIAKKVLWFDDREQTLAALIPIVYERAAELEKLLEYKQKLFHEAESKLQQSVSPNDKFDIREMSAELTQIRARILDLHETAMTAILMRPVLLHAKMSARTIGNNLLKVVHSTIPKIRLLMTILVEQSNLISVSRQAEAWENVESALAQKIGVAVSETNGTIESSLEKRREKAEGLRELFDVLGSELRRSIDIEQQFLKTYDEVLDVYRQIVSDAADARGKVLLEESTP